MPQRHNVAVSQRRSGAVSQWPNMSMRDFVCVSSPAFGISQLVHAIEQFADGCLWAWSACST
jgi:hypothetical protein